MKELIQQLTINFGVNEKQAAGIILKVKEYAELQCPEYGNSLDSIFNYSSNLSEAITNSGAMKIFSNEFAGSSLLK